MEPRFTLFQKIMTAVFIVLQLAVMISDGVRLAASGDSSTGAYYYVVNLVLCALLLAVFILLILNPRICISTDETDSDEQLTALISASRTYMCFIAVDIAMIFAFVMFISKNVKHPAVWVIAVGVLIFVVGAAKYIYDSQNPAAFLEELNAEEYTGDDGSDEEAEEYTEEEQDGEDAASEQLYDEIYEAYDDASE